MNGDRDRFEGPPAWVDALGVAAWVRDPDGRLAHLNVAAVQLFGSRARDRIGFPCHRAIAARDARGRPFCSPDCPILRLVRAHGAIAPHILCVDGVAGAPRWLQLVVLPIPADSADPWLLHCALPADREWRMRQYLERVAGRPAAISDAHLTPREGEVLELLVHDLDSQAIAARLHVSYVTVRNHVQHILDKLGAHSIQEVVAQRVLGEGDDPGT